jgi:DMSO reductase anchor subunit
MLSRIPSYQRGFTLIGFLVVCVLVGFAALVVMRLFPLYNESFKVRAALEAVASQPDIAQKTAHEIRTLVFGNLDVVLKIDESITIAGAATE